jgi:hypothetical protein
MKKTILVLAVMIGICVVSFAQESNVESQRRGWNVPRGEREHYGFGRDRMQVQVEGKEGELQLHRGVGGPRGPMMMRRGMSVNHMCNCECNKKMNKKGGKNRKNRKELKIKKD